jgi:hypothetical protein
MSDMCAHRQAEPVLVGDETVAQVCVVCLDRLPLNWGCDECEWVEIRTLSESVGQLICGRPCEEHR